jgi:hypothetical protein
MADSKISKLPAVSSIDGTEEYAVNESNTSRKATATQQSQYTESRLQHGVLCSNSGAQTITTATWTELAWNTEVWKVGDSAIHSTSVNNSRMTAQVTGEYLVTAAILWEALAVDFITRLQVYKGGATELWRTQVASINDATYGTHIAANALVQLTATDYIEIRVYHTRGSNADVQAAMTRGGMYLVGR